MTTIHVGSFLVGVVVGAILSVLVGLITAIRGG